MIYALDIETTGLNPFKDSVLCVGVVSLSDRLIFSDVSDFRTWLSKHPGSRFVLHNGAFDLAFLRRHSVDLFDAWHFDTRSAASLMLPRPDSLGLERLSELFLQEKPYKLDRTKMESYSWEDLSDYCLKDCELTLKLYHYLIKRIDLSFVNSWLMPATKFCAQMEWDGVWIDQEGLKTFYAETLVKKQQTLASLKEAAKEALIQFHDQQTGNVRKHYKELYETAKTKAKDKEKCLRRYALLESAAVSRLEPFNWNSPEQIKWLLKDFYELDLWNPREEKDTTNEAQLRLLAGRNEVASLLLDYRESEKMVSTCIPALAENCEKDGFVHAHYHVGGTRTGRLSSSNPNLQQIPRGPLRSYVQASSRSRVLVTVDYAQIEVRIIAEVAKEEKLLNAFKEEIDPYSIIAQKLLKIDCPVREIKSKFKKERDVSKTAGLSIFYGTGAAKLQEVLQKELGLKLSLQEARQFIDDYRLEFSSISNFKRDLEKALANRKSYRNLLGRPFIIESNDDLYMKSLNTLVQGSASDLVVLAALRVQEKLKTLKVNAQCRLLIHDEQVWEMPLDESEVLMKEVIEPAMTTDLAAELNLTVPLKIEYAIAREWSKP